MTQEILELTTTTQTEAHAQALANRLVEQRLAGCVQIAGPIQSVYRWQGQICTESEYRLSAKSILALQSTLIDFLNEHHPYDTPELLINRVHVSEAYGKWLAEQVSDVGDSAK